MPSSPEAPSYQQSPEQDLTFLEQRTIRYLSTDSESSTEKLKHAGLKTEKLLNPGIAGDPEEKDELQSERARGELTEKSTGASSKNEKTDSERSTEHGTSTGLKGEKLLNPGIAKDPEKTEELQPEKDDRQSRIGISQKPIKFNPPTHKDHKEKARTTSEEPKIFSVYSDDSSSSESSEDTTSESSVDMNESSESFGLNSNITINITTNSKINFNAPLTTEAEEPAISRKCYQTQINTYQNCLLCQSNDGKGQSTAVCQNCPTFNLQVAGFMDSGKYCIARVSF